MGSEWNEGQSAGTPGARLAAAQDVQQLSRILSVGRERIGEGGGPKVKCREFKVGDYGEMKISLLKRTKNNKQENGRNL